MKKFISVMLAALMLASTMSATIVSAAEVAEPVYVVAGSESLCGLSWNGNPEEATDNIMTFSDDVYTKVFENVAVGENYEIKVVENNVGSDPVWIGNNGTDFNVVFNVVEACDVTVTLSADKIITVSGDGVTFPEGLDIENMFVVGNAADETDPWMNGAAWNPSAEVNKMEEVAENVYSITFEGVEMFEDGYQGKFAANGAWTHSWGGVYTESGVAFDAVYNGDNIVVPVSYETANVTLTLDLSAFDFATKTGAKATITVVEKKVPVLYGDVNLDGEIDVNDVTCIQMFLAKYENVIDAELGETLADVSGDGLVDIVDVTTLQKYLVGGYTNTGVAGTEYVVA